MCVIYYIINFFILKIHASDVYDLRFKENLIELFDTPFTPNEICELTSTEFTLENDENFLKQSFSEDSMPDLEKNSINCSKISQDEEAPSHFKIGADHLKFNNIFDIDLESTQIDIDFTDNKKLNNYIKNKSFEFTTSNEIVYFTCYNNEILTNIEIINSTIEFDNILKVYYYKKSLKAKRILNIDTLKIKF